MDEPLLDDSALNPLSERGWLVEQIGGTALFALHGGTRIAAGQSAHQAWEVWDTPTLGRLYRLDGRIMAAEYDECVCHETLVHVAGLAHPGPRTALILGGGDGASARELLRYPSMNKLVVAELDEAVVDMAKRYLPTMSAGAFEDKRVTITYGDAAQYVREAPSGAFDLIVFDLTDPDSGAGPLFSSDFFSTCARRLTPLGSLCIHLGSPLSQGPQIWGLRSALRSIFPAVTLSFPALPSYGGTWCMAYASFSLQPGALTESQLAQRISKLEDRAPLRFLTPLAYRSLLETPAWAAL